ncbi:MAG: hypothetical protein VYD54_00160, partial [Bdellovibrionota bacterium]|nr:hypothetical protein [Bdellovibrionota bacterium]
LKSLAPGGPLSQEETETIEKELELFEQEYQKGDIKKPDFVKYEDIKKWKLLGDRYALGLNDRGKKLAVFDLSLPDRESPEFKENALLAFIQTPGYYFRDLISLIRKLIKEKRKDREYAYLFGKSSNNKLEKTNNFLSILEKAYPHKKGGFPLNGWEKVKWKNNFLHSFNGPPESFTLADIDFERTVPSSKRLLWKRKWSKLGNLLKKYWGIPLNDDFLSKLRWEKKDKGYALYFNFEKGSLSRPRKIVDFVRWRAGLGRALAKLLVKEVTIQLGGLIPGVGPLLKVSLRRWFDFQDEQMGLHRYAFLEYLNAAQRGESLASIGLLSKRERIKAAVHIESHQSNIFFKILKLRNARWWKKEVEKEVKRNIQSQSYLLKKNYEFEKIGKLFARGFRFKNNKKNEHLFLMGLHPLLGKKPVSCLNYQFPYRKRARRQLIHIGETLLELIPIEITGVSMALNLVYDFLIKKGETDSKIWESRLLGQLRLDNQNEKWNHEMELLYEQKLNPFELSFKEEKIFLSKMRRIHNL